ncbi:class I SAM-dependent methyltransferase [Aestuariivirga litoralis]|nr:class I SAM-dependent methyltransferase [Aestuariivirga litoralis]
MAEGRTWSKAEIEAFLAAEDLKYQKITLPHGLSTPGADRKEVCEIAFAGGITGKTVLDIGSYLGYFCFEALERGAAAATGLEVDPGKLRQARTLAEIKGLNAEFVMDDIETKALDRRYDIVLCLNVLHHLFNPIGVLHKLAEATRDRLVLEVASLNPRDARKLGVGALTRQLIGKLPVVFIGRGVPSFKSQGEVQKYFFTPAAVLRILGSQRALFSRIEIVPSSHKQRFIVVATRRRIGTLVIVSGPTSSGKSTFLKRIGDGQLPPELAAELPSSSRNWPMTGAGQLLQTQHTATPSLPPHDLEGAVLHYDFLRPFATGCQEYPRDQALDLIACAEKVVVVVLKPDMERLSRQLHDNEIAVKPDKGLLYKLASKAGLRRKKRHRQLAQLYAQAGWVDGWYGRWNDFIRSTAPGAKVITVDESWYGSVPKA